MLMSSCDYNVIAGASTIASRLGPISSNQCLFLVSLEIFKRHYLMAIRKKKADGQYEKGFEFGIGISEFGIKREKKEKR